VSWIQKLYDTYEQCAGARQFAADPLMPISHTVQQAHIEIVLDGGGNFQRANAVPKEETVVPATEGSAGRTGKTPPPHPLCDKLQYCAADYPAFGGRKPSFYREFVDQLGRWCNSEYQHPKACAVLAYVKKGDVVADLVRAGLLFCDKKNQLLTEWKSDTPSPHVFKVLTQKDGKRDQGDAFVRWRVQIPGDPVTAVWEDLELKQAWISFDAAANPGRGLCMVTGRTILLARSHPKRLRHGADGAKLISSNDNSGFTFRGRFSAAEEACGVGFEITQKAHNALRWLIARQGAQRHHAASGQVFVAWAVGGKKIPDPLLNTSELFGAAAPDLNIGRQYEGDAGQHLSLQLKKLIEGYRAALAPSDEVVVMGLDSASPGRMAVTYYRELNGSEFLDRVLAWHQSHAWQQRYSKDLAFIGAPAPREIAAAAYGRRLDDKLRKSTVERILPSIVDGRPVVKDLVDSCVRRACNRAGLEWWDWRKSLGIACGLFRGFNRKENYQMSLEQDRNTRDYLFGRLLAIAERIEEKALYLAGEKRETKAAQLMQRFADRPCSTWRNIELGLSPYRTRLRAKRPGALVALDKQIDEVANKFNTGEFTDDSKLSGEFLLGYHCQRAALWAGPDKEQGADDDGLIKEGEE
jgi:CRISPR-associated protein Csd1